MRPVQSSTPNLFTPRAPPLCSITSQVVWCPRRHQQIDIPANRPQKALSRRSVSNIWAISMPFPIPSPKKLPILSMKNIFGQFVARGQAKNRYLSVDHGPCSGKAPKRTMPVRRQAQDAVIPRLYIIYRRRLSSQKNAKPMATKRPYGSTKFNRTEGYVHLTFCPTERFVHLQRRQEPFDWISSPTTL